MTFTKAGKQIITTVEKEVDTQMEVFFSNTKSRIKRKQQKARARSLEHGPNNDQTQTIPNMEIELVDNNNQNEALPPQDGDVE